MCGIIGFSGQQLPEGQWGETYKILNTLFAISGEQRGLDATGFVARTSPYKNELAFDVVMGKQPLPAAEFIAKDAAWRSILHRRCTTVLGHVRWATHGSPEDNCNNHPLTGHSSLYLVHNGVLANHKGIASKHGLELTGEVDSELILRFVEAADHPATGLDRALRKVEGSMAAVVYDGKRDALYLARDNDRPLWILRLKNDRRWWFASTREILLAAFKEVMGEDIVGKTDILMPLAPDCVHVLSPSGRLIALPGGKNM